MNNKLKDILKNKMETLEKIKNDERKTNMNSVETFSYAFICGEIEEIKSILNLSEKLGY